MTHAETGLELGIARGTVQWIERRALAKLRRSGLLRQVYRDGFEAADEYEPEPMGHDEKARVR